VSLRALIGPDHVLHTGGEGDDLFRDWIEQDPAHLDLHLLHAAIAAGEFYPNADMSCIDAGHALASSEEYRDRHHKKQDGAL
jgi:hypothetical protein